MAEYWDLYNARGKRKHKVVRRGERLKQGEYHIVAEGWIRVDRHHFLLQQRAYTKRRFGGLWYASVGGAILAGETPLDGLIREGKEEIGVDLSCCPIRLKRIEHQGRSIFYIYLIDCPLDLDALCLQEDEVNAVRIVNLQELRRLYRWGKMVRVSYYPHFFESATELEFETGDNYETI
ncbi:NUDIX domain-containing protein [Peptoniphilus equinus]|uniref:NUDIX domain-containing protein n=1 Tax=Peptoniphilus equinus TaxID=3016343 RepID=A0ABY7QRW6_9FIRM|nr:NUDIX domain-containing protein [Peptoniphilus equinus]WBW49536.1 NUDIX domain-containing protein [Peptoniphilus equinus]